MHRCQLLAETIAEDGRQSRHDLLDAAGRKSMRRQMAERDPALRDGE